MSQFLQAGQPPQQAGPYPQPQPSVPQQGPNAPWQAPTPVPPATPAPGYGGPLPPAVQPGSGSGNVQPGPVPGVQGPEGPNLFDPAEKNYYGPQQIAGTQPSMGEYQSVHNYADQAHQNAMRYLAPQMELEQDRLNQEIINRGVDPMSEMGIAMKDDLSRRQNDAQTAAAFSALGFGQGIQDQMFGQSLAQSQLAGDMQKALWQAQLGASGQGLQKYVADQNFNLGSSGQALEKYGIDQNAAIAMAANELQKYGVDQQTAVQMAAQQVQQYGMQLDYQLGQSGQDLQRYGMDLQNQLGMGQLDLARQGQDFSQMLGLENIDFRNRAYGDQQQQYYDQMMMAMLGMSPAPGMNPVNPYSGYDSSVSTAAKDKGLLGDIAGWFG